MRIVEMSQDVQVNAAGALNVSVIPATKRPVQRDNRMKRQNNIRVAAYCRVSTGDEKQQTSYSNQKAYYSSLIQSRSGWKFAGIYADEAISGTSRVHRKAFNRMIDDAMQGEIDYIITKSISRFARNTVDTLNCVRQLRQQTPPVGIYFEKENINTLDATGELILTILSALAQDESRSISDNIRWTFQKNFQAGIPQINLNRMLGYDKGVHGEWLINKEQAKIVQFIFDRYVCGYSANAIAGQANALDMRTVNGNEWTAGAVLNILRNEKYVGDLEMQKTITKDFLTHRSMKNTGEAPKYYVKDHHINIIDRFTWDKVQLILENARKRPEKGPGKRKKDGPVGSPFFNLICGARVKGHECGERFFRMTYSGVALGYTDERSMESEGIGNTAYMEKYTYAYPVWRCKRKYGEERKAAGEKCPSTIVQECALEQSFMEMLYWLKRDWEGNGENSWLNQEFKRAYDMACKRFNANQRSILRMEVLNGQIRELEEKIQREAKKMSVGGSFADSVVEKNQMADESLIEDMRISLDAYQKERATLESEQSITGTMKRNFDFFIQCLKQLPERNEAGLKMNINRLDVQGSIFRNVDGKEKTDARSAVATEEINVTEQCMQAPDYLHFERGIYIAFMQSGKVKGDTVEYLTNFGVKLTSIGNSRTLDSFLGFRRCNGNGEVEFLDALWKINNKKVQYRRKRKETRKSNSNEK